MDRNQTNHQYPTKNQSKQFVVKVIWRNYDPFIIYCVEQLQILT